MTFYHLHSERAQKNNQQNTYNKNRSYITSFSRIHSTFQHDLVLYATVEMHEIRFVRVKNICPRSLLIYPHKIYNHHINNSRN
jgi:hypothetical protein